MKIFSIVDDKKNFCKSYRILGREIFKKTDNEAMYRQYRKYQDCALMAYKLLGFCDIKACKQATGELRDRQERMTQVLKSFDRFARERNITYWLEFGTLLGAYRHQGFIPWDYDTDVCMLREDLYRHLDSIQEFIEKNCGLRLRPAGAYNNYFAHFFGGGGELSFDIFPIDSLTSSATSDEITAAVKEIRGILKMRTQSRELNAGNYRQALTELIDTHLVKRFYDAKGRKLLTYCPDFGFSQRNLALCYDDVFPLVKLKFEGVELPVPQRYQKVLNQRYGNVEAFPPLMMEYENTSDHEFGSMAYPPGISSTYSTDTETRYAATELDKQGQG